MEGKRAMSRPPAGTPKAQAPSLERLSLRNGQAHAPWDQLPAELWVQILAAVSAEDPCRKLGKLCGMRREWNQWCKDGRLYEAANKKLGWYGRHANLGALQAEMRRREGETFWNPPPNAEAYFKEACLTFRELEGVHREWSNPLNGDKYLRFVAPFFLERPYFMQMGEKLMRWSSGLLLQVDPTYPEWGALAEVALAHNGGLISHVPSTRADYGKLARIAVKHSPWALESVRITHPAYYEVAKAALGADGAQLDHVPIDLDDFGELAAIAVASKGMALQFVVDVIEGDAFRALAEVALRQNAFALEFVPKDRDDYTDLALIAVQQNANVLSRVPQTYKDFHQIAMVAVTRKQGEALYNLAPSVHGYAELCNAAVRADGRALRYVQHEGFNQEGFQAICLLAVQQNGLALEWTRHVDPTPETYMGIAMAAVQQNGHALRFVRPQVWNWPDRGYERLCLAAVAQDGSAMQHVANILEWYTMPEHIDYAKIAVAAVQSSAEALRYVWGHKGSISAQRTLYEPYKEIALAAVLAHKEALQYVVMDPKDRYMPIARASLRAHPTALEYVHPNVKQYGELAMVAVDDEDAGFMALQHVPTDRDDYFEIARRAVQVNGLALQFVPTDLAHYDKLAAIAVNQSRYAINIIPVSHACYERMRKLHNERMTPPERGYVPGRAVA